MALCSDCFFGRLLLGGGSTFVKLAYAAGFTVSAVVGGQGFIGAVLTWLVVTKSSDFGEFNSKTGVFLEIVQLFLLT